MSGSAILEKCVPRTRRAFALGLTLALCVLGCTILAGLIFVRAMAREQILQRDAEALYATTLMEQLDEAVDPALEIRTAAQIGFDAAVRASRLRGVMGIRFYAPDGSFSDAFPASILPAPLEAPAAAAARALGPHGAFRADLPLSDVFIYLPQFAEGRIGRAPILLVTIPLHPRDERRLAGIAQFIIEGGSVAAEYARLDQRLERMALAMFAVSGVLLAALLGPVFLRARKLNEELVRHGDRLRRANDELALAARVSAVGAVSAHLMHGLRNPLASLSEFVASHDGDGADPDHEDWDDALTAARRMRALVDRVTEVLGDAAGQTVYELPVAEMVADIAGQLAGPAGARGVRLDTTVNAEHLLSSDVANLAGLVLVNLLENAVEVTPRGGAVALSVARSAGALVFRVADAGPGFPAERLETLFLPGASTREGGSGLGLAISKQVADFLGAELALAESSGRGCVFELRLPLDSSPLGPSAQ